MVDPATAAGLGLAVVPLIISALENYEDTFKFFIIFTRKYKKEVEDFQDALRVQKTDFDNQCLFLVQNVTSHGFDITANDPQQWSRNEQELEDRLKAQLEQNYEACVSVLRLINGVLTDILTQTKTLDILLEKRQHGFLDRQWLKVFRERNRISFSKNRFHQKLGELQDHIQNLRKIREHVAHIKVTSRLRGTGSTTQIAQFRTMQYASSRLYETLSTVWRCDTPQEHFANISLDDDVNQSSPQSTIVRFNLAWTCPTQVRPSGTVPKPLRLSVEAYSEKSPVVAGTSQPSNSQRMLVEKLDEALGPRSKQSVNSSAVAASSGLNPSQVTSTTSLQDLYLIPNLCQHLGQRAGCTDPTCCVGFLQKTKTFKHLIYTPNDRLAKNAGTKTLEDALTAANSHSQRIPLPEKLNLAKFLAQAVLRFHSTPWMTEEWRSRDVVFFGINDLSQDPLCSPFLRTRVSTSSASIKQPSAGSGSVPPKRTFIRNQTLFNLGVMLVELAYDAPLQQLVLPEDDQQDPHTLYWAATRLGDRSKRDFGPKYAEAVKICLHGGFGASSDLEDPKVQETFYHEVVQKLKKFADDVAT